ncbi:40S ribosomal protein S15 [Fusarium oxysporum f. sp. conglutinans]|nr:40S ribosomal protein S15 [Fusarium oxysporum f. sp. conglutinans]
MQELRIPIEYRNRGAHFFRRQDQESRDEGAKGKNPTSLFPCAPKRLLQQPPSNRPQPGHQISAQRIQQHNTAIMADEYDAEQAAELKRKRAFRKFSYRGIDLDQLLDLSSDQLRDVVHARARRRINRGLKRRPMGLIKKLRKAKQEAQPNEKPDLVKTHLRDMIVVPEMIGSVIGIYSGKEFNQVEIKPEMVGHYLAEFSISYKPVKHGRPGIGATHSSRFIPLK